MTVLVQCVVCDETFEVRLRIDVTGPEDRWETVAQRVAAEGGCPECGCMEVSQI